MRTHLIFLTAFALAPLTTRPALAQSSSAPAAESTATTQVGCVARVADSSVMTTPAARRGGGSNSPKSSTPVGGNHSTISQTETRGSNSPKASTPLGVAPKAIRVTTGTTRQSTFAAMTAKASVPIPQGPTCGQ